MNIIKSNRYNYTQTITHKSKVDMTTINNNINTSQITKSYATRLPEANGKYTSRLSLNGQESKDKIAIKTNLISLTEFTDKLLNFFGRERKWVKISIVDTNSTKPILININSLSTRTLLTRKEILSQSSAQLSKTLANPSSILWDYKKLNDSFPNVRLINLDRAPNRIEGLNKHLTMIGEQDFKYTRLSATDAKKLLDKECRKMSDSCSAIKNGKPDYAGRYACFQSHLRALKEAKEKNLPTILILEDDVRFSPNHLSGAYLQKTLKELPENWDMLFLGHYDYEPNKAKNYSDHLVRPGCPYDLHAYVVNARMYDRLINSLEAELKKENGQMRAIDVVIGEDIAPNNEVFACKANVAFQDEGQSSITNQFIAGNYKKEVKALNSMFKPIESIKKTANGLPIMNPLLAGTLYQMTYHLSQVFDKHGIRYWADGGTLLGAARHGALIPHDDDIDLCIFPGDESKLKNPDVIKDLSDAGLEVVDHWLGAKLCAKEKHPLGCNINKDGYSFKTPNIDLFFTKEETKEGKKIYSYSTPKASKVWPEYHHNHDDIFNENQEIKKGKFGPIELNILWKTEEYCKNYYGKNALSEAYLQYDHIHEKGLAKIPVRLTDYRAGPFKQWDKISSIPNTSN